MLSILNKRKAKVLTLCSFAILRTAGVACTLLPVAMAAGGDAAAEATPTLSCAVTVGAASCSLLDEPEGIRHRQGDHVFYKQVRTTVSATLLQAAHGIIFNHQNI